MYKKKKKKEKREKKRADFVLSYLINSVLLNLLCVLALSCPNKQRFLLFFSFIFYNFLCVLVLSCPNK